MSEPETVVTDSSAAIDMAERLLRRHEKRCREWVLRHAGMYRLHTSEDYPRRLETLGLVVRKKSPAYLGHEHVLEPTPLLDAVVEILAKAAGARLSPAAIAVLSVRIDDYIDRSISEEERAALEREHAISFVPPPWSRRGHWLRTSFGYRIWKAAGSPAWEKWFGGGDGQV